MRRVLLLALLVAPAGAGDDTGSIKTLISALGSSDEETRAAAAQALGEIGPAAKSAAPALAKMLGDETGWVARVASQALVKIGPDSVPSIVKALGSSNDRARQWAISILDKSFARDLKPYLRQVAGCLKDASVEIRTSAAHALGQQGDAAVDVLLLAFAAREDVARDAAVSAFVQIGAPAVQPLTKALSNGSERVRGGAARALGGLKAEGAAETLLAALSDKSTDVKAAAARALGKIAALGDKVLPKLFEGLGSTDAAYRDACVDALADWGQDAVPGLNESLGKEESRAAASLAFLRMGPPGGARIRDAIAKGAPAIQCAALRTIPRFIPGFVPSKTVRAIAECLHDAPPEVRVAAALALGSLGPAGKDDGLVENLSDENPDVRAAAFHALGDLGVEPRKTEDKDPRVAVDVRLANWKILDEGGPEDFRKIAFDASQDAAVRAAATRALGEMGLAAEGIDLTPLLEEKSAEIRRAAAEAIARTTLPSAFAIRESRAGTRREKLVDEGLAWLAKAQGEDGSWDGGGYTSGMTSLALLAFLAAGCGPQDETYGKVVQAGLDWLLKRQDTSGVFSEKGTSHEYVLCQGIATIAVTEAYLLTKRYAYRRAAQWGLDFIAFARNPRLGWRYEARGGESDTHVTTWLITAIRLGDIAGLHVDEDAYAGAGAWIELMTEPDFGQTGYNYPGGLCARVQEAVDKFPPENTAAMTAAGLWSREMIGGPLREAPQFRKGVERVFELEPSWSAGHQDMVYWYFATLALCQDGDANYRKWLKPLLSALAAGRDKNGSWRTEDAWSSIVGAQSYTTSMGVLMLLTPTRYPRDFVTKPKVSPAARAAINALKKAAQSDEDPQVREIAAAACARLPG
jgi:HEAT repeat protein